MKRLLLGALLAVVTTSLFAASSASGAEFTAFVGCDDLSDQPVPAHVCTLGDFPAAYFESSEETEYEVCVVFPSGTELCAEEQFAEAGVLYLNSITSEEAGLHVVSWYVEGIEVRSWAFRLDPPPPPPAPPVVTTTPATTAPVVAPAPAPAQSPKCLKARRLVARLSGQVHDAATAKRKAKLKARLKGAKNGVKQAC